MEDVLVDFTLFYKKKISAASKIQFWGASPLLDDSNAASEHLFCQYSSVKFKTSFSVSHYNDLLWMKEWLKLTYKFGDILNEIN